MIRMCQNPFSPGGLSNGWMLLVNFEGNKEIFLFEITLFGNKSFFHPSHNYMSHDYNCASVKMHPSARVMLHILQKHVQKYACTYIEEENLGKAQNLWHCTELGKENMTVAPTLAREEIRNYSSVEFAVNTIG